MPGLSEGSFPLSPPDPPIVVSPKDVQLVKYLALAQRLVRCLGPGEG